MALWVADGERGLMRKTQEGFARVGPPGYALCAGMGRVYCAGAGRCLCCRGDTGEELFDFPVPPGVCVLCLFRGMVCALSTEADCVTAYDPETGEMLYAAPAGAYPRDLCPGGEWLAVAGGAAGEILLLDGEMRRAARFRLPGTVCGACFQPRGLYALCAAGEEELKARLLRVSLRGVWEEIFLDPQPPASLCALADGKCLVGCREGVIKVRQDGKAVGRWRCAYPARLRLCRGGAIVCDSWQGEVRMLSGQTLYRGGEPLDAVYLP